MKAGQFIREYRLKKGMTQEDLAARTELSARTIQRIENDEVEARAYTLRNIAAALELDFEVINSLNTTMADNRPVDGVDGTSIWLPLLHLSGLFNLLLPSIIIWLIKRHQVKGMQEHGVTVINFQLSMLCYEIGYVLRVIIFIPNMIPFGPTLMVLISIMLFSVAMMIINTIKVLNKQPVRYPLSLHLLKPAHTENI